MAGQANNFGPIQSFIAGGAIIANRAVKLDTTINQVLAATAITDDIIGVALSTVASGESVEVVTMNGAKVKLTTSAAVAIGAQLMPTAAGAGKASTAAGATAKSFAIALSATAADGETCEAILRMSVNGPVNT